MTLPAGTPFGPYEILAPIGAGGMGEVYRARDPRLGRDVAIKVLPAAFASDPDRRVRFEREARAVAALSHPNILVVHDVGVHEGHAYLVTEVLDGETLRARLEGGALPVRKAIDVAVQIARGLTAAHDKAIAHRDLKPENVFLLKDGQVKILDFGLARHAPMDTGATQTVAAMTDPGTVLGTAGYMAPEQVRGQAVDGRADLFALGAVLYEMLSGTRAFQRDTAADTLTAILKEDPPELAGTRTDFSPALDRIARHCLEKNVAERFQTARDVAFALEALSGSGSGSATSGAAVVPPAKSRRSVAFAVAAATTVLAVAGVSFWLGRRTLPAASGTSVRFETKTFDQQVTFNARFAPDGQTIVYSAALEGNKPQLFVIRPGSQLPQPLGRPRTHLLSVSSKGELAVLTDVTFIGFRLFDGTLARMTMDGEPRPWMEHVREADWSPDGSTLALIRALSGKDQLEYPIGKALYETPGYLSDPRVSPDGRFVAFMEHPYRFDDRGFVKMVDTAGHVTTLAGEYESEEGVAWSADGTTVFFSAQSLASGSEYQPHAATTSGRPIVREALSSIGTVLMQDVARDGRWLVVRLDVHQSIRALLPGEVDEREFSWLDNPAIPFLSADGRMLLFTDGSHSAGPTYAVAMRKTDGSPAVRLGEGAAMGPSPDGKWALGWIATPPQLILYPIGPGDVVKLDRGPLERYASAGWFPDGKRIVACGNESSHAPRCYAQDIAGGPPKPVTSDGPIRALVAPDNRTLAVGFSDGSARILPADGGPLRSVPNLVTTDRVVAWSHDGTALFFVQNSDVPAKLERVDVATGKRTFVRSLAPPDRAGLVGVFVGSLLDDGRYYAYGYGKTLTTLFVVTGAR
jgi:hypothetical protein